MVECILCVSRPMVAEPKGVSYKKVFFVPSRKIILLVSVPSRESTTSVGVKVNEVRVPCIPVSSLSI